MLMKNIINSLEALGFRLLMTNMGALGIERASALGRWCLLLIGPRVPRHRKVLRNLEVAFPDRDAAWREGAARAMWGQFGRSLAEYAYLPELCRDPVSSRIEFVADEGVREACRQGRPIVFVAAHQANWNLPAVVGKLLGIRLSVLYRRRKNAKLEAAIEHWRNQMPCGFIDVDERAPKLMLDELRNGRSIGLYIDRRSRDGELLPFFDVQTPTPTVAARLALKTGAAFVTTRIERLPGVRFRITLHEPIEPDPALDDTREMARQMTSAANRQFESWIRENPEQWLSTARRFPRDYVAAPARSA